MPLEIPCSRNPRRSPRGVAEGVQFGDHLAGIAACIARKSVGINFQEPILAAKFARETLDDFTNLIGTEFRYVDDMYERRTGCRALQALLQIRFGPAREQHAEFAARAVRPRQLEQKRADFFVEIIRIIDHENAQTAVVDHVGQGFVDCRDEFFAVAILGPSFIRQPVREKSQQYVGRLDSTFYLLDVPAWLRFRTDALQHPRAAGSRGTLNEDDLISEFKQMMDQIETLTMYGSDEVRKLQAPVGVWLYFRLHVLPEILVSRPFGKQSYRQAFFRSIRS